MPVVVQRPGDGEDEEGGDDVEEEEEEEIMLVGGGDSKKRSTPSKEGCPSTTVGMRLMVPPKSQPKRPRRVPPSICFTPKRVKPRARRLPRRRSRHRCAVITACVYVSSFFASICTLSRVLFCAGLRLVPFFMFW